MGALRKKSAAPSIVGTAIEAIPPLTGKGGGKKPVTRRTVRRVTRRVVRKTMK